MAALPYQQIFWGDYFADTQHLTTEEHGAYLLLIGTYWQRGRALDNSNGRLANVTRLSDERWTIVQESLKEFFTIENDIWTHSRIEFDLEKVLSKSTKISHAAKDSARDRANRRLAIVERSSDHTDTDIPNENFQIQFEQFWNLYPKKEGKKKAQDAFSKVLKKTSFEILIEGLQKYVRNPSRKLEFTLLATTWLNGERWNDEVQTSSISTGQVYTPHRPINAPGQSGEGALIICANCEQEWPCAKVRASNDNPF